MAELVKERLTNFLRLVNAFEYDITFLKSKEKQVNVIWYLNQTHSYKSNGNYIKLALKGLPQKSTERKKKIQELNDRLTESELSLADFDRYIRFNYPNASEGRYLLAYNNLNNGQDLDLNPAITTPSSGYGSAQRGLISPRVGSRRRQRRLPSGRRLLEFEVIREGDE